MPYAVLEEKFHSLPEQSFAEVSNFFDYIFYKFSAKQQQKDDAQNKYGRKFGIAKSDNYWIAPDFDETPDCFKEYM